MYMKLIIALLFLVTSVYANEWYIDTPNNPFWRQMLSMDEKIVEKQTKFQRILIFQNKLFGRTLALNDVIQSTEADEAAYHEMLVHVPMMAHPHPKRVLIIGGGDGGILREVLRYSTVEKVVHVEIDSAVIELSKKYLSISRGAFNDPRHELLIQDGNQYVATTDQKFDVIICSSSDPVGPNQVLFEEPFFRHCKKILTEKGIFVNQNGCPFLWSDARFNTVFQARARHFKDTRLYVTAVPTNIGGFMTFGWASNCDDYRLLSEEVLQSRLIRVKGEMQYYNPAIHKASFALPEFVIKMFKQKS